MTYGVIYALTDPHTDEVRYIGQTTKTDWRAYCERHFKKATRGCHQGRYVSSWLRTLDRQPGIHLVCECASKVELDEAEDYYIKRCWRFGFRLTNSKGGGSKSGKHSPEARAKMGDTNRGRKHTAETRRHMREARLGKTLSDETRARISAALRGRKLSVEHCAKISALHRGKKLSAETRAKLSAAHRGKPLSPEHRAAIGEGKRGKTRGPHTAEARANISAGNLTRRTRERETMEWAFGAQ
jgi:DNA-binding transcriptional ArsR family regulator